MKHMLVLMVLLLAAAACYIAGSGTGVVGMLLELGFWFVLIKNRRGKRRLV